MYKFFICLRYLSSRIISYVAIGGMTLGVAVLVIVMSVMGGFQQEFQKKLRGTESDLTVDSRHFFGVHNPKELEAEVNEHPEVEATSPYVDHICLINTAVTRDYGFMIGLDPAKEAAVGKFGEYLMSPREIAWEVNRDSLDQMADDPELQDLHKELLRRINSYPEEKPDPASIFELSEEQRKQLPEGKRDLPGIVVGVELFRHRDIRLKIGDRISLLTATDLDKHTEQDFIVTGVFKSGIFEHDRRVLYIELPVAQEFIDIGSRISGISVKVEDYGRAATVRDEIQAHVRKNEKNWSIRVRTWVEKKKTLLQAVNLEKWLLSVIIIFMIFLAALNITSILTMSVVEKTKDLGILKALGGTSGGLFSIFVGQGLFICGSGAFFGSILGLVVVKYLNEIADGIQTVTGWLGVNGGRGYHPFPPDVYYLDKIPTQVDPTAIAVAISFTVIIGFVLSAYPAYRASRLKALDALRWE